MRSRIQKVKMMKTIRGKTALVTGASRGIGTYIARALAEEGMNLVLVARTAEGLESTANEIGSQGIQVLCIPWDIGQRNQLEALVERVEGESGGIDVLVNNAGLTSVYPYDKESLETIDQIIEVNLTAPMILSRLFLPKMIERGGGHIVNIASQAGLSGAPYQDTYAATKHGLVGFTRSLYLTAIGEGYPVSASVICSGPIADVGIIARSIKDMGIEVPSIFGTSPPEAVAKSVVNAIIKVEPEILVTSSPAWPSLLIQLFSPRLLSRLVQKMGLVEFSKSWAYHQIEAKSLDLETRTM
jgi:short-subunit dehydrogenase